jgi:hypothetical protein
MIETRSRLGLHVKALIIAAFLALCVPGCAQGPTQAVPAGEGAATVEEVTGTDLHRITLTERAIERLGLKTDAAKSDPRSKRLTVPYAAVLYDSQGKTWVYTNPEPRVYVRQSISVERIDGAIALLTDGPRPGTPVVTLGAEELFGAEFDTAQ